MNKTKYFRVFTFLMILIVVSCKKENVSKLVDETVYVRFQGADMPVYLRGNIESKIIILVVHGGPGGNGLEYRSGLWTVPLEENYTMAYWDQRGQGMSHGKYDNISLLQMAKDMNAVVSALKHKCGNDTKIFAYGHSWGGTVTAKYFVSDEIIKNVTGWISSNGAHDMPKNDIESVKLFRKVASEQINKNHNKSNWEEIKIWANSIDTLSISEQESYEINQKGFEVEEWLIEDKELQERSNGGNSGVGLLSPVNPFSSSANGGLTNLMLSNETRSISLTDDLRKVTLPLLVLTGKYDFVVPPALAHDLYNLSSSLDKKIVVFEKSGHSPMTHEPIKYRNEIISFIEANK